MLLSLTVCLCEDIYIYSSFSTKSLCAMWTCLMFLHGSLLCTTITRSFIHLWTKICSWATPNKMKKNKTLKVKVQTVSTFCFNSKHRLHPRIWHWCDALRVCSGDGLSALGWADLKHSVQNGLFCCLRTQQFQAMIVLGEKECFFFDVADVRNKDSRKT